MVIHPVGERQWEDVNWNGEGAPHLHQHGVRDLSPVVVPQHGYCGRSMTSCTLVIPLGAEAIR
jgi:hypothetical protein